MKLFTRSPILKNSTVEITSPRFLECSIPKRDYKKQNILCEVPVAEFPFLIASEESPQEQETITKAKTEAENILAEARKKAEELLKSAQEQSAELRRKLEDELRKEIIPLAQAEGRQKGLEAAELEAESIKKQAKNYLELARKVFQDELDKADQELVGFCLQICERIIHSSLSIEPTKLLNVIRNLAVMPWEKEGIKIHLSPKDWEWYKALPAEDKPPYPVIIDESLQVGDSFLECAEGVFDARIDSQLETLKLYLFEELDHGRLEGIGKEN